MTTTLNLTLQGTPGASLAGALAYGFITISWGIPVSPAIPGDFQGGSFPAGTVAIPDGQASGTLQIQLASGAVSGHRFAVVIGVASPNTILYGPDGKAGVYAQRVPGESGCWAIPLVIP